MIRTRFMLLALVGALLAGTGAWAQEKGEDKKEPIVVPRGTLPPNWRKLNLTPQQAEDIRKIRGLSRYKIQQLEKQIEQVRKDEVVEMLKVLTEAQKARIKEVVPGFKFPEVDTTPPATKPDAGKGTPPAKPPKD